MAGFGLKQNLMKALHFLLRYLFMKREWKINLYGYENKRNPVFGGDYIFFSFCGSPTTKEAYLENYEAFVKRVEKNHKNYHKKDWEYADKKIKQYNEDYYQKFERELTIKEKLKTGAFHLKYQSLRERDRFRGKFKPEIKKDVEKLKKEIKYYMENDMDDDLDKLKKGAEEIGDSLGVVVEELIEEIKGKL